MTRRPMKLPMEKEDSTYLTVVHPYPPNTNLQLPTDRRTLALWLACCTGKPDVLRAMFHKPKAAGMVIIEVDREFERFDALLGMHSWTEFLLAPTEEEAGNSSKVFYCTYHTAEAVRGAGWNRVEIEDHWFQGWRPDNDRIKHPYPKSTYCDVPPESKTGAPMCHRLPQPITPQELPAPQVNEFKEDNAPKLSTTAMAMMAIFGTAPRALSVEGNATGTPRGATAGASTSGAIPVRDQSRADGEAAVEDDPWDGYNAPRPDPPTKVKKRRGEEWICPKHGPMCIPGICTVRAGVDRDERWQKEREERAENKRKWKERKEKKERKREMELARAEGGELPHRDQPPPLVNGPRGPSSRSGTDTDTEGNGDDSHDQDSSSDSLRFRTESPDPPPPSQPPVSPGQDSEEECTQTVFSAEGEGFPMSADMGREHPIAQVQSSSAQARDIGATGLGNGDGDEIEIETEIQEKRILERNKEKGKDKTEIALNGHGPDFETVLVPEVPGDIGRSWCDSNVAW
ncbi:hypothetical protein F5888DRAFT_1659848 [Russula emetica]|nr:hypothetical protein F5888DRAFT_1659848 [Russula emetica]